MTAEASGGGKPVPPLAVILCTALVLAGIAVLAWGAGRQYRALNDTLDQAVFIAQQQQRDILALKADVARARAELVDIRSIAQKSGTRIIEYRTVEVPNAHAAVDALPAPDVQPALRAVADAYIAGHAQPVPAHQ